MTTTDGYHSPISQLLTTLGLTREDLQQRSDEMRQFLTAENSQSSRVGPRGRADSTSSHISSLSRSNSIFSTSAPSLSRASSISFRDASPPVTPVKLEATEAGLPQRHFDSMDVIIERQRQARKEKRQRREKEKDSQRRASMSNGSPTPSSASSRNLIIDSLLQRRDDDQKDVQDQLESLTRSSMEASLFDMDFTEIYLIYCSKGSITTASYPSAIEVLQRTHSLSIKNGALSCTCRVGTLVN